MKKIVLRILVGLVIIAGLAQLAGAQVATLSQKQFQSLFLDGGTADLTTDYGQLLLGYDGTNYQVVSVNASGELVTAGALTGATTLTDDFANPTDNLNTAGFMMGWDNSNTNWNRVEVDDAGHLQVDVLSGGGAASTTTPADDEANPTANQQTSAYLMGWDASNTNWNRVEVDDVGNLQVDLASVLDATVGDNIDIKIGDVNPQLDDTDKIAVSLYGTGSAAGDEAIVFGDTASDDDATTATGALIAQAMSYIWDPIDSNFDRVQSVGADTGRIQASDVMAYSANSPEKLAVTGTSACTNDAGSDLTTNTHYKMAVQAGTDTAIHCCFGDGIDCTADNGDMFFPSGAGHFDLWIHTTNESVCCITANSGTATVYFDPQTAP